MAEETAGHKTGESGRAPKRRRPYLQLFPADLRSDEALRLCSRAARSFWTDLFGLMHFAEPRGYLLVSGRQVSYADIGKILGDTEAEVAAYIEELERNVVFSRTAPGHELGSGVIYCRRMVREAEKAARDAANGLNGGNPELNAMREVAEANAAAALRQHNKKEASRERTRRYRARQKAASQAASPSQAGDTTVTGEKCDGRGESRTGSTASVSVTGVNPQNLSSISRDSLSSEVAPTEQARPPSPLIGGGRATRRRERKPIPAEDPTEREALKAAAIERQRVLMGAEA